MLQGASTQPGTVPHSSSVTLSQAFGEPLQYSCCHAQVSAGAEFEYLSQVSRYSAIAHENDVPVHVSLGPLVHPPSPGQDPLKKFSQGVLPKQRPWLL